MSIQQFTESNGLIRIVNDEDIFICSVEMFQQIESEYPELPSGMIRRSWSPEFSSVSDGDTQFLDDFDGSSYLVKLETYHQQLEIVQWTYQIVEDADLLFEDNTILNEEEDIL